MNLKSQLFLINRIEGNINNILKTSIYKFFFKENVNICPWALDKGIKIEI